MLYKYLLIVLFAHRSTTHLASVFRLIAWMEINKKIRQHNLPNELFHFRAGKCEGNGRNGERFKLNEANGAARKRDSTCDFDVRTGSIDSPDDFIVLNASRN